MTIQDFISIVLSKIKLIILFTIVGGIIAFSIAEFAMPRKYASNVRLFVKSSTSTSTTASLSEMSTAQALAGTYIVILQDDDVYEKISEKFSEDYTMDKIREYVPTVTNSKGEEVVSPSYIKSCFSISIVDNTEILNVSAISHHPQISQSLCKYMAVVAPDVLGRIAKVGTVEKFGDPKLSNTPVSPNVNKITVIGALIGLIVSTIIILLVSFFNNKVTSAVELKEKFGVSILAEIPNFEIKAKKGAYK